MTNNKEKMTSKTTKTILFSALILTLIVPVANMDMVNAQVEGNDQTRLAMKKQNIEENFQQFLVVRNQTNTLETELNKIEESIDKLSLAKDPHVDSLIK